MARIFKTPFGAQGDTEQVPEAPQGDGSVSLTQGFGYDYEREYEDPAAKDIRREVMNGLFHDITEAIGDIQLSGIAKWDAEAAPYPAGAVVWHDSVAWLSTVGNNSAEPGTNANWSQQQASGTFLQAAANLSDVPDAAAARTNLGIPQLGTAATRNITTTGTDTTAGRVLKVGDFGLGVLEGTSSTISDWDAPPPPSGFYRGGDSSTGTSPIGTGGWFVVACLHVSGSSVVYQAVGAAGAVTGDIFTRRWDGTSWSDWRAVAMEDDLGSAATRNVGTGPNQIPLNSDFQPSMTGSITLNGTTDNTVVMTDIVTELALEIGDVIRIDTGAYNKLHTVESITDNSSIVVNYEHAGNRGDGSLKLTDFTGQATVTRIAKWFNAPVGLGQGWVDVSINRSLDVEFTNTTGRSIFVSFTGVDNTSGGTVSQVIKVDGYIVAGAVNIRSAGSTGETSSIAPVPYLSVYEFTTGDADRFLSSKELR